MELVNVLSVEVDLNREKLHSVQVSQKKKHEDEGPLSLFAGRFFENPHPELGTYIYGIKILYDWTAFAFGSPVYLRYDPGRKLYVLHKCHIFQRIICLILTVFMTFSVTSTLYFAGKQVLENRSYIVAYFDFMNQCVLNFFIYGHLYVHWFQQDLISSFVNVLQTTPLIACCATPIWKIKLVATTICAICFYLPFIFLCMYYGYDYTSLESIVESSQANARVIFWLDRTSIKEIDMEERPSWILCVIALLARFHNSYMLHITYDAYIPIGQYCVYLVVKDFFESLCTADGKSMKAEQVLSLLDDFRQFMKTFNAFFCIFTINFTAMTMTYHSVHLFDCLQPMPLLWKMNSYSYICYVVGFYSIPQAVLVKAKKLRKWLRVNDNCMKIPHLDLNSILYDLLDFQFGIRAGRFFVLNGSFCGTAIANMISYSMLNMLSKQD